MVTESERQILLTLGKVNTALGELKVSIDNHEERDDERHVAICKRLDSLEEHRQSKTEEELNELKTKDKTLKERRTDVIKQVLFLVVAAALSLGGGALAHALGLGGK